MQLFGQSDWPLNRDVIEIISQLPKQLKRSQRLLSDPVVGYGLVGQYRRFTRSLCYPFVITPDQCAEFDNEESEDLTDL